MVACSSDDDVVTTGKESNLVDLTLVEYPLSKTLQVYNADKTVSTSVVLRGHSESQLAEHAALVNYVLVKNEEAAVTPTNDTKSDAPSTVVKWTREELANSMKVEVNDVPEGYSIQTKNYGDEPSTRTTFFYVWNARVLVVAPMVNLTLVNFFNDPSLFVTGSYWAWPNMYLGHPHNGLFTGKGFAASGPCPFWWAF